jgi:preprotein translocase subunit SecG
MILLPLLAVSFLMKLVMVLFVLAAILLILVVLIQKGKGGGLSGALAGGAMGNVLGAKSKEPLTYFTIFLVCLFLVLAMVMSKFYRPSITTESSSVQNTSAAMPADTQTVPAALPAEDISKTDDTLPSDQTGAPEMPVIPVDSNTSGG